MTEKMEDYASKSLGDSTSYAIYTDKFDSSLLVRMPRELARKDWDIVGDEFKGFDVWHCRESTFLTNKGLPVAGTLKFGYQSDSKWMVESKSMKLYLNSFDMCKMSDGVHSSISKYVNQVREDLSKLLETDVVVFFHQEGTETESVVEEYHDLYDLVDIESLEIDYSVKNNSDYLESIDIKQVKEDKYELKVFTNVLRSRCRHTKQKDTGSAYFHIKCTNRTITLDGLLRYIISFREQNEFHEFLAEKFICDIKKVEGVTDVMVMLLYARRGSLDINPVRTTDLSMIPIELHQVNVLTEKTQIQ